MIRYLDSVLSGTGCPEAIAKLQDTMTQEQLSDHKQGELYAAIDAGTSVDEIKALEREALEEIQRTVAKHIQDQNNG